MRRRRNRRRYRPKRRLDELQNPHEKLGMSTRKTRAAHELITRRNDVGPLRHVTELRDGSGFVLTYENSTGDKNVILNPQFMSDLASSGLIDMIRIDQNHNINFTVTKR